MSRRQRTTSQRAAVVLSWLVMLCLSAGALAVDAVDRIGVPGPIRFGKTDFALQWTSNPPPELYKQEYVPAGQRVQRDDSMILIDVRPVGAGVAQTAAVMVEQIDGRKATDPVANVELLVNDAGDEVLLDFLISASDPSGIIVDWNAYRYVRGPDGQGTTTSASAVGPMAMQRAILSPTSGHCGRMTSRC